MLGEHYDIQSRNYKRLGPISLMGYSSLTLRYSISNGKYIWSAKNRFNFFIWQKNNSNPH